MNRTALITALALAASALPAAAQNWPGFYAGVSVSSHDSDFSLPGTPFDYSASTTSPGIFIGYNYLVGPNTIVGGELSYGAYDQDFNPSFPASASGLAQLRARLGYTMGDAMPYLAVGVASADFEYLPSGNSGRETGYSIGAGLEYMINPNMSVRAEYQYIEFSDVLQSDLPPNSDVTDQSLSIGVAWHF